MSGAKKCGKSKYSGPKKSSLVHVIERFRKKEEYSKEEERVKPQKRKRVSVDNGEKLLQSSTEEDVPEQTVKVSHCIVPMQTGYENSRSTGGHRAGFDAFMTGFIFASIVSEKGKWTSKDDPFTAGHIGLLDQVNRMYLMGKNIPFLIRTGTYANKSAKHCSKIMKVRSG